MAFSPETYALLLKKIEEGGGGGSFPTPTAADVGSALVVVSDGNGGYTYALDPYPGYDVVIKGNAYDYTSSTSFSVIKGSHDEIMNKFENGTSVVGLLFGTQTGEYGGTWSCILNNNGIYDEDILFLEGHEGNLLFSLRWEPSGVHK